MILRLPSKFKSYKPNVIFYINSQNFAVKTAETKEELLGAFKLRHDVFFKERKGVILESGLGIDEFDIYADQLIILNKSNNNVAGTYRLISSKFNDPAHFGNWKYFNISDFLNKKQGNVVEMEWACTHESVRNSQAIHHIWLGLGKYFRNTFSRYMFGQINVLHIKAEEAACIYKTFLENQLVDTEAIVYPIKPYLVDGFEQILSCTKSDQKILSKISRLFVWYLKLGAKIHGHPIFDPEFNSYGFFISLDFKHIENPKLVNRYEDAVYLKDHLPD